MTNLLSNSDVLYIERMRAAYTVPRDHPAPQDLRGRLDEVIEQAFPAALERALGPYFAQGGEDLWLIRKLECNVDLHVDHDRDAWHGSGGQVLFGR